MISHCRAEQRRQINSVCACERACVCDPINWLICWLTGWRTDSLIDWSNVCGPMGYSYVDCLHVHACNVDSYYNVITEARSDMLIIVLKSIVRLWAIFAFYKTNLPRLKSVLVAQLPGTHVLLRLPCPSWIPVQARAYQVHVRQWVVNKLTRK